MHHQSRRLEKVGVRRASVLFQMKAAVAWSLLLVCGFVHARVEFAGYHSAHYRAKDLEFGSSTATVSLDVIAGNASLASLTPKDLKRKACILKAEEATVQLLDTAVLESGVGAVFIVLPTDLEQINLESWKDIEKWLIAVKTTVPIYVIYSNERVESLYAELASGSASDTFHVSSDAGKMMILPTISINALQGVLLGKESEDDTDRKFIVVASSFDTFSAAPDAPNGVDSSATGVVAVLQLARMFGALYAQDGGAGQYDILFLLTPASRLNYAGTAEWLHATDDSIVDNIAFALCLDALGRRDAGERLYLHFTPVQNEREALASAMRANFQAVGKALGVEIVLKEDEMEAKKSLFSFQHQRFVANGVPAATLTHVEATEAPKSVHEMLSRLSLLDTLQRVHVSVLSQNIGAIAEAIATIVYGIDSASGVAVFDATTGVDSAGVEAWLQSLSRYPRSYSSLAHPSNPVVESLRQELATLTRQTSTVAVSIDSSRYAFAPSGIALFSVYRVKPFTFDIIFTALIALYGIVLFVAVNGKDGVAQLRRVFK